MYIYNTADTVTDSHGGGDCLSAGSAGAGLGQLSIYTRPVCRLQGNLGSSLRTDMKSQTFCGDISDI